MGVPPRDRLQLTCRSAPLALYEQILRHRMTPNAGRVVDRESGSAASSPPPILPVSTEKVLLVSRRRLAFGPTLPNWERVSGILI